MMNQGSVFALTGRASDAIQMNTSAITAWRSTGSTQWTPWFLSYLAKAYAELGQFDDAWRCIGEAMTAVETTKEKWCEAEVHRIAGEIALKSPKPDTAEAEAYFDRALAVARKQQAKSWELRATMSMARFWRDQGKRKARGARRSPCRSMSPRARQFAAWSSAHSPPSAACSSCSIPPAPPIRRAKFLEIDDALMDKTFAFNVNCTFYAATV